jgi:lipopolysaccharide export system permease protein
VTIGTTRAQDSAQDQPESAPLPDLAWPTSLQPATMMRLSAGALPLSAHAMLSSLQGRLPSGQPPSYYLTGIVERLTLPLFFIVMISIALPVIYIPPRTGTRSMAPVWCLGAGLSFIVFQGLLRALGNAGTLPAFLAVGPGIAIFALGVGTVLLKMEET